MKKTCVIILFGLILSPHASVWAQATFGGRLLSSGGRAVAYNFRIDIYAYSAEEELRRLQQSQATSNFDEFSAVFKGMFKGVFRIIGDATMIIPFHAAIKRPIKNGVQILLVAKNQVAEPGVQKGSKKDLKKDRFLAIILDLDHSFSGEGKIYEDAKIKFTPQDIEIESSFYVPRMLFDIKLEKGNLSMGGSPLLPSPKVKAEKSFPGMGDWLILASPELKEHVEKAFKNMDFMLYEEAISEFDRALAIDAEGAGLRTGQAYSYFRLNRLEKAVEALHQEIKARPDDLKALVLLSFIQYKAGRADEAERAALAYYVILEKMRKEAEKAQFDMTKIMQDLFPNAGVPAYILALRAKKKSDVQAARTWLIRAQDLSYSPSDCWLQAVASEFERENCLEALRLCQAGGDISFSEEAETDPSRKTKNASPAIKKTMSIAIPADVYFFMGLAYKRLGMAKECLACLKTAAEMKPFDADILKNLAIGRIRENDIEEAARLLRRVIKLYPQDFQSEFLLDQVQNRGRNLEDFPEVLLSEDFLKERDVRYQYVFKNAPEDIVEKSNRYVLSLIENGMIENAARWLRSFVEIYENSPTIHYNLAQVYNSLGQDADALKFAVKAIEHKNDYRDAYDLIGNVFFKIGDFGDSIRYYQEAVRLDRKDPVSFYNLGCACNEVNDLENAEKNWLEALRLEKASPRAGKASGSTADVLKIAVQVEVEPISAPACRSLGYLYAKQGKIEKALELFKKAIAFNPSNPTPFFEIGKLYLDRNEASIAQEYFKKYLSLGGDKTKVEGLTKKRPSPGFALF